MCGIAGWIDWKSDLTTQCATLEVMTGTLACSGPDGHGMWLSRHAALGCRHLNGGEAAGRDDGGQPVLGRRGGTGLVLLYTGKLQNGEQLAKQLAAAKGGKLEARTGSDGALLLRAYMEWGGRFLERSEGVFSFVIWKDGDGQLVMGTDPAGSKPLYYSLTDDGLVFGSSVKAVVAHPSVGADVTTEEGAHPEVCELGPSYVLTYDRTGLTTEP